MADSLAASRRLLCTRGRQHSLVRVGFGRVKRREVGLLRRGQCPTPTDWRTNHNYKHFYSDVGNYTTVYCGQYSTMAGLQFLFGRSGRSGKSPLAALCGVLTLAAVTAADIIRHGEILSFTPFLLIYKQCLSLPWCLVRAITLIQKKPQAPTNPHLDDVR